jgi:hypothetical protein
MSAYTLSEFSRIKGQTIVGAGKVTDLSPEEKKYLKDMYLGDAKWLYRIETELGLFFVYHSQDCCETVRYKSSVGTYVAGATIQDVYRLVTSTQNEYGSQTETTLVIVFDDGDALHLLFNGSSNGYYYEGVSFFYVAKEDLNKEHHNTDHDDFYYDYYYSSSEAC